MNDRAANRKGQRGAERDHRERVCSRYGEPPRQIGRLHICQIYVARRVHDPLSGTRGGGGLAFSHTHSSVMNLMPTSI